MGVGGFSPPPAFFVLLLSHAYTVLSIIYMRFILKLWWNFFYLIKEIGGSNLGLPQIFFACPDNSFKKGSPKNKLHIPKEKNKIQRLTLSTRTQRSVYWITFSWTDPFYMGSSINESEIKNENNCIGFLIKNVYKKEL